MAGFELKNTLAEHGGVTRGVCQVDVEGWLTDVVETSDIIKTASGASTCGIEIDENALVSMNMWGLNPDFLETLENGFKTFLESAVPDNPQKAEYLLPIFIGGLLQEKKIIVKVLPTADKWFGFTFQEDRPMVVLEFRELIEKGVYQPNLYSDLKWFVETEI